MEKKSKLILSISIIGLLLVFLTGSYAYFSARITGLENASTLSIRGGTLEIHYSEGNEIVEISNVYPREEAWLTKTITLIGNNSTDLNMGYELGLNVTSNTFANGEISYSITNTNSEEAPGAPVENQKFVGITNEIGTTQTIGNGVFITGQNQVHEYLLEIFFLDTGEDQNDSQGAIFNARLTILESPANNTPFHKKRCYTDDYTYGVIPEDGTEFTDGIYTYGYNKVPFWFLVAGWNGTNSSQNGWGVILNNNRSTAAISHGPCEYVNNLPVVSLQYLYSNSYSSSIDLSSFDTSNVTSIQGMFYLNNSNYINLNNFNTSKITNMNALFSESKVISLDLSSFNTSNVTDMSRMFYESRVVNLDLSNFNTSNVTTMDEMFYSSYAKAIDLSSFDTRNVTNMNSMFTKSNVKTLDLSSFDTSKVKGMSHIFEGIKATSLNLSNFVISSEVNVTDFFTNVQNLKYLITPRSIDSSKMIALPTSYYDSLGNEYTQLTSSTPASTMLYKSSDIMYDWDFPSNVECQENNSSSTCNILLVKGNSYNFNTNVLSANKLGTQLNVSTVNNTVLLDEEGMYQVNYTITDTDSSMKNATLYLNVTIFNDNMPKFVFNSSYGNVTENVTQINISDDVYVMPDVNATKADVIGSITVDGQTVYAPIVATYSNSGQSPYNVFYPLFSGVNIYESINNEVVHYSNNTMSKPNQLSWIDFYDSEGNVYDPINQVGMGDYNYTMEYGGLYRSTNDLTSNLAANTYYVKYSYEDKNGNIYYYFIGYKQAAYGTSCFTAGTLITLANGNKKRIEDLTFNDKILAYDFMTGNYVEKNISVLVYHGNDLYTVNNLKFSDGTVLKTIGDHGVFDYDLNKFVYINEENYQEYIGHNFVKGENNSVVKLEKVIFTKEYTGSYSLSSSKTSNAIAEGMLTVAPPENFYNWIKMDGKMHYDVVGLEKDIEKYGLYTYDIFKDYVTEKQYEDFNGAYLKIPVEKGYFTFDYILELIKAYSNYMPKLK